MTVADQRRRASLIDLDALCEQRTSYRRAAPFPHTALQSVIDDLLLRDVAAEFPPLDAMATQFADEESIKSAESSWECFGPATRALIGELHSEPMLEALSRMTGIEDLLPDPHLFGGGQHQIRRGGYLRVHADFNRHPRLSLERRLNLLLYLNAALTHFDHMSPQQFNDFVTVQPDTRHGHDRPGV